MKKFLKFPQVTKCLFLLLINISSMQASSIHNNQKASKFHIVTVASYRNEGLNFLEESCKKFDLDLKILGMDEPYHNNKTKLHKVSNYIKTLPDNDILLFVDGFDVLILGDKEKILQRFYSMNAPFVITCDKHCWPLDNLSHKFPNSSTPFKYINSGCYIGYIGAIKNIFSKLPFNAHPSSDQAVFSKHYVNNKKLYKLDTTCKISLNLHRVTPSQVLISANPWNICYKPQNLTPVIVQGNGPDGRKILNAIYRKFFPNSFLKTN